MKRAYMKTRREALGAWQRALTGLKPPTRQIRPGISVLCWGKAAAEDWLALRGRVTGRSLVIAPVGPPQTPRWRLPGEWLVGEHPLPGPGSLIAGKRVLEFLKDLPPGELWVFLSGGASSLAWVLPSGLGLARLRATLTRWGRQGFAIEELNRRRAQLCLLKKGGAGRWVRRFSPRVRVRVSLVSDVAPFGPEVVGSGPFWTAGISHAVRADNRAFVAALAREFRRQGERVLAQSSGQVAPVEKWRREIARAIGTAGPRAGILLHGGEPTVTLPAHASQGGRLSHLAALLARDHAMAILRGELAFLCVSSDGRDGDSEGAGVFVDARALRRGGFPALEVALNLYATGAYWERAGALIPERPSVTNLQDAVVVFKRVGVIPARRSSSGRSSAFRFFTANPVRFAPGATGVL